MKEKKKKNQINNSGYRVAKKSIRQRSKNAFIFVQQGTQRIHQKRWKKKKKDGPNEKSLACVQHPLKQKKSRRGITTGDFRGGNVIGRKRQLLIGASYFSMKIGFKCALLAWWTNNGMLPLSIKNDVGSMRCKRENEWIIRIPLFFLALSAPIALTCGPLFSTLLLLSHVSLQFLRLLFA